MKKVKTTGGLTLIVLVISALIMAVIFWSINRSDLPGPALTTGGGSAGLPGLIDDNVWIGNAAGTAIASALPDCQDSGGNHINYNATSNTVSCGTSGAVSGVITPFLRNHTQGPDITEFHVAACVNACESTTAGFAAGADDLQVYPIFIANDGQFGDMAVHVTASSGGSIIRLGVYEALLTDTNTVYIGDLVEDYGTVSSASAGFKTLACTSCVNFSAGLYFLAYVTDSNSVSIRRTSSNQAWGVHYGVDNSGTEVTTGLEVNNFSSGAFPDPFPTVGPDIQSASPIGDSPWIAIQINNQ